MKLKIVTYNIYSHNNGCDKDRLLRQIALLKKSNPDIICLQEAWGVETRKIIKEKLSKKYKFIDSSRVFTHYKDTTLADYGVQNIGWLIMLTFAIIFVLSPILAKNNSLIGISYLLLSWIFSFAICILPKEVLGIMFMSMCLIGIPEGLYVWSIIFFLLSGVVNRRVFHHFVNIMGKIPVLCDMIQGDLLGLVILVKKKYSLTNIQHIKYGNRGYTHGNTANAFWLGCFEGSYMNRGAIAIECNIKNNCVRIVNTHLSNGVSNPYRFKQCEELVAFAKKAKKETPCVTVVCADANAHETQPEIVWLNQTYFIDTFKTYWKRKIAENKDTCIPKSGYTWDNNNPYVKTGNLEEPNQRLDYIWILRPEVAYCRIDKRLLEKVNSSELIGDDIPLSDHYGILTKIDIT